MKQQLRDAWVAALRSGKYEQARGQLKRRDAFCCLGVLCEVIYPGSWDEDGNSTLTRDNSEFIPLEVSKQATLDLDTQKVLVNINDIARRGFSEIADYIEANVPVEA